MSTIVPTVRPYAKPAVVSLTGTHVFVIDHPTLGMMSMSYADLRTQLDATYVAAQAACAASQSAAGASQTAAAASAATATTQASAAGVSATAAAASQVAAAASASAASASQTAAGVSASAAGASQTAAGVSATAADSSATAAGLSETASAASASTASTQAAVAITQASNAAASASSASASNIAAGVSATAAAGSANAAGVSEIAAAASAAAALASQTASAGSASTATAQANASAASAGAAAASATTALNAQAVQYKGGIAGASVPATAPLAGDYYKITTAGTSQSKTWVVGDQAIYNGSSGSWTQVTGFFAAADAADIASKAALIEREGLRFDGTNYAVFLPANPWSSSGFEYVFEISTTSSGAVFTGGTGSFVVYWDATSLTLNHQGVTSGCVFTLNSSGLTPSIISINYDGSGYRVLQNGTECVISILYTGTSTGNRWNYTTAITQPAFRLGNDLGPIFYNGVISRFSIFNYALTAGERTALIGRGLVTLPEQRGGSMNSWLTGDSSTFTSGVGLWTGEAGASVSASGGQLVISGMSSIFSGARFPLGRILTTRALIKFTVVSITGGTEVGLINSTTGADYGNYPVGPVSVVLPYGANLVYGISICRGYASSITGAVIDDVTIIPLGTLFEQDSGQRNAGYVVRDTSGNNCHLELPETGVSINGPADTGFIEYTRTTDGYLIGDRRVIPSTGYLVEVVATGNGTVTLGESAGTPANVCASVTLTSTPKILPILVTQTTGGKLYCDLGTATTATFKIRHRAV